MCKALTRNSVCLASCNMCFTAEANTYRFVRAKDIAIDGSYNKFKKCKELFSRQNFQNHFPNVSNIDLKKKTADYRNKHTPFITL